MASFFDEEANVAPLISVVGSQYVVEEETLAWIQKFPHPFGVVACAGKYRTGKSFLLNRIVEASSGRGFNVGETVQACTKGILVYKRFIPTGRDNLHVLVLDTEGIDALDANDTHDVRIFTLALLLSPSFMYNSVGAIDETSLQTLSLMTRVTQNVRVSAEAEANASDLADHMPTFYWILRDFSLRLVDRDNQPITPDQYLTQALVTDSDDTSKTAVRGAIRDAFRERRLVTLPRPANVDDQAMQTLEFKLQSVNPKFGTALSELRSRLLREVMPMRVGSTAMTGGCTLRCAGTLLARCKARRCP